MGYKIENKDIRLSRLTKVASGKTGDVYNYKETSIKIFKDMPPLDKETARILTKIKTDRILLPRKLVFYNDTYKGYTTKYIPKNGKRRRLIDLTKSELINITRLLNEDSNRISSINGLLDGVSPENVIFNGNLYLADPSKYTILQLHSTKELEKLNQYQLYLLVKELIMQELRKCHYSEEEIMKLELLFEKKDIDIDLSDFLKEIMDKNESIRKLVKRL